MIKHAMFPSLVLEMHNDKHGAVKQAFEDNIFKHVNEKGFSNEQSGHVTLHHETAFDDLFRFASNAANEYVRTFAVDPNLMDFHVVKSWMNIIDKQGTPYHCHADAHLSFVYYLNLPPETTTPIIFHQHIRYNEPFFGMSRWNNVSEWNPFNSYTWQFTPVEGQLMMFPSHMFHETPRLSDALDEGIKSIDDYKARRVSIAGDFIITYKDKSSKPLGLQPVSNWRTFK